MARPQCDTPFVGISVLKRITQVPNKSLVLILIHAYDYEQCIFVTNLGVIFSHKNWIIFEGKKIT
jgi:hypothetical protein